MLTPPDPIESGPWMLDPQIVYLNHGSFGARTEQVHDSQQGFKQLFERSPIQFLDRSRDDLICEARDVVSSFLHSISIIFKISHIHFISTFLSFIFMIIFCVGGDGGV